MCDDSGAERSARGAPGPAPDPAVARFRACRWHDETAGAEFCKHGEVLPYAGRNGFRPRAWCPDCTFYKARRRPRKQDDAAPEDFRF